MKLKKYIAPKMVVVGLSSSGCILLLSNYGNPGTPGSRFGVDDQIIDYPDF